MTSLHKIITTAAISCIVSLSQATQPSPLMPVEPQAQPAQVQNNTKLLTDSFNQTGEVIAFVENNLQLAQLCDDRLQTEKHSIAFNKWFAGQESNFRATMGFKFAYEKTLASLYGDSILETFKKRDRITLSQVSSDIEIIAAREEDEFARSCNYWYISVEDESSFFYTQLSIGLYYFGQNAEKLAKLVADPANW